METKVCYKCGEEKPIEEFALNKARKEKKDIKNNINLNSFHNFKFLYWGP